MIMKSYKLIRCVVLLAFLIGVDQMGVNGYDYGDALDKSLLFFEAQRSGKLPSNQRVKWRGDSGLSDGYQQGVDLVGGYYDAGDHVKFGLPMAYSVAILSWSAIDFAKELKSCNQFEHTLDAIRWGTDYFLKAHSQPNLLWAQVGDGVSDHLCWERAEDMSTPRTAYQIDSSNPGSDLAGETAAALAAASIAFKPYNSTYSYLLLVHAKQLFSFADQFRGRYDNSITNVKKFYASASGYSDELLWSAAWLYRATGEDYYLKYVIDNSVSLGGTGWGVGEFSWDDKYAGLQVLLSKVVLDGKGGSYTPILKQYQAKADYFVCACMQKNGGYNVPMTPGGLLYLHDWNNMQYVSSAAFLLAIYSDYLSTANTGIKCPDAYLQPQELLKFSQSQADYILGKNPKTISYLVGYGSYYPVKVHHRGASIASIFTHPSTVGCVDGFESWYHNEQPNPNILYGALVGGPDQNDQFSDERYNYESSEPSLSGTAPLIGVFSKLHGLAGYSGPSYGQAGYHSSQHHHKVFHHSSQQHDKVLRVPQPYKTSNSVPVEFLHTITNKWTVGSTTIYRHKVVIKNTSQKTIKYMKLGIGNLSGSLWGLSPTNEKNIYLMQTLLKPSSQHSFVYVQGGPQAIVKVLSYN